MIFAQAGLKQIDETAMLISSHGWGLTAIALIVVIMLVLFGVFMFDSRNREKRFVEDAKSRESEMKARITTMEDRQYREMASFATGYHKALTEQTAVCHDLAVVMKDTTKELALCRQGRERTGRKATGEEA